MKFEPFTPISFYTGKFQADLEEYNRLISLGRESGELDNAKDDRPETDYFSGQNNLSISQMWFDFLSKHCNELLNEILNDTDYDSIYVDYAWTQITRNNQWHPPHSHGDHNNGQKWSFVWYIDVDDSHKGTEFFHPNNVDEVFSAKCEPGNIYVWPANIIHYQEPSFSETERKILSGNFILKNDAPVNAERIRNQGISPQDFIN